MTRPLPLGTLLFATTMLVAPAAFAQTPAAGTTGQTASPPATTTVDPTAGGSADSPEEQVEVSTPGADLSGEGIVVTGRNIPNVVRATPQVLSVLSTADIARTGEGDIAGALTRVTGLSVVGNGFVFVRGLGDRYSSALLNGSPLPSPEPLRRSVPLDIFPTTIVSSAAVQKSYSVNYPGEFGGGVINLTTRAVPEESFVHIGASASFDTFSTSNTGYVYDGGDHDWAGFDDGTRRVPSFITSAPGGAGIIPSAQVAQLENARTSLLQTNNHIPINWSGETSMGTAFDLGDNRLGVVFSASIANSFRTRDATQQDAVTNAGAVRNDFRTLITDNRIVANGLLGLGYEFGEQKIRATGVYIHDTLKQARGSVSSQYGTLGAGAPVQFQQNTSWFERQLIEGQGVGEFKFGDISLDLRGAYANSKRLSPYERQFNYFCNTAVTVTGNSVDTSDPQACNGAFQSVIVTGDPFAQVVFSRLNENLWSGQADLSYRLPTDRPFTVSAGYFYSDSDRTSVRLPFAYRTNTGGTIPAPYNFLRPDLLLSNDLINNGCPTINDGVGPGCVRLFFIPGATGGYAYDASLTVHAGYVQAEAEALDGLRATIGVRYETADENVVTIGSAAPTSLNNDYFLPAATLTWNFAENMQLRAHASKTIARPQFRELSPQQFQDFESDRLFFGNPFLRDSELYNLEGRYEWYFDRGQRLALAGFYKRIDNPIEQVGFRPTPDARLQTGFSYVPSASLYGAEAEIQKYVPLDMLPGDFWATRRILAIANYTYTQSSIKASNECVPQVSGNTSIGGCPAGFAPANLLFRDGAPLTGQSDHLVNLQLGIEDTESTSQLTFLFSYASERVTNRGPGDLSGVGFLPDIRERPGIRLDVVARQGIRFDGKEVAELKFEGRNLTGTDYQEFEDFDAGRVYVNRYKLGTIFTVGLGITL